MGFVRPALIVLLGMLAGASATPRTAAAVDHPSLFGMAETRSENLRPFTKWTWMVGRYRTEQSLELAPCAQLGALKCRLADWRRFLATLEGKPRTEQILAVNTYMNRRSYIEDLPNYGVPDYWATPREFLTRDGDCEDYAIAKFMSLRTLGFKPDELRLVVLQDLNLNVAHAVLVVYHEGKALLLDNQIRQVVETSQVRHYRPLYSINEQSWWLHKPMQISRATP
ncbi:MAG: transglutaminase-like cysteine peptidase [Alphaproteobacteria bacterium]|nr:transglutaminase-like cysteine peptidase [Alphaproteobacteria bacterium]